MFDDEIEAKHITTAFLRRWSTMEFSAQAKALLKEDVKQVSVMLEILSADTELVEQAEFAPDRHWFIKQLYNTKDV